jgi:2-polyprenyl-3-methyl-5-hydroxy-6-metoxy-1,4-benzoquinol methylase
VTEPAGHSTEGPDYAQRLVHLETARWKRILDVQRPYRWNLRRLGLGRVLDVGCGIGRNLANLGPDSVGVDHNAHSVAYARSRGLTAYTTEQFLAGGPAAPGGFDTMLVAHVVEHMLIGEARELVATYLPLVRPGGSVLFVCPQERGYSTDATHVSFTDAEALADPAGSLGLGSRGPIAFRCHD